MRGRVLIGLLLLNSLSLFAADRPKVSEGFSSFTAKASAPIPDEVTNQTQARALARDAAIVMAQDALITRVLEKKTHSHKTLAEAQEPSLEIQEKIKAAVKGARVVKTRWTDKECQVVIEMSKSHIKEILRKN